MVNSILALYLWKVEMNFGSFSSISTTSLFVLLNSAIIYFCCRVQKSPPIKRKLTLTRKKAKEVKTLVIHLV